MVLGFVWWYLCRPSQHPVGRHNGYFAPFTHTSLPQNHIPLSSYFQNGIFLASENFVNILLWIYRGRGGWMDYSFTVGGS